MAESSGEKGIKPIKQPFWLLFVLGTSASLAGNLFGWILTLGLLYTLTSDQVVEGYAWLTTLFCWTLVPLVCVVYGLFAGWWVSRSSQRRPTRPRRFIALWGLLLGAALWLVLGLFSALMVILMARLVPLMI